MEQIVNAENTSDSQDFTALEFKKVKFYYPDSPTPALNNVSFSVKKGEFLSVIGHNGSGKSTLARLVCGLLEPDRGSVSVWGMNVAETEDVLEIRKHVGIVFQNPDNQMVASIVEDDVAFGPENLGVPREEIGKRIEWALSAVGMEKYRTSTPTRLSGGQKQRIAVAGVLAIKPDIIILDESTAMLDPRGRKEVMDVVRRLNKEEGMTVILITHFMDEALLADRTIVLNKGEIVLEGTPERVFESGEELLTYNLCLPDVTVISNRLNDAGISVKPCLLPDELAQEISTAAGERGLENASATVVPHAEKEKSGEWDIDISDLTFTYSKKSPFATHALNGVNLHIGEGEFFGIIGHTGSGKSTLVQHLNALIKLPQAEKKYKAPKVKKGETPPTMPKLTVGKYDLSDKKCNFLSLRADVGMVFQYPEYQLFAETVFDDVAFGLKNFNKDISKDRLEYAVAQALEAVGLNYDEVRDKSPFDLSGGQKRRVAIAGVIVTKPRILILDEPAAGLDPLGKKEIMELLHNLHRDWCKTVIIVSHDMDEIAQNCTRACVVSEGKIVACDRPEELFTHADELKALGLDVPLTAKICSCLEERGISVKCDYTLDGFSSAVISMFKEGQANA
ncbi:MAG: energy-coupling factor transporter ATPase [Candidatus Coproplasma sp.]